MSIICPTDCDSLLYPVNFDDCAPQFEFGEINRIYVASRGADDFSAWDELGEWTARLSEDGTITDVDTVVELVVRGSWEAAEEEEIEVSDFRKAYSPSSFTVNFEVDDLSDENYEFMRWLECNPGVKIWIGAGRHIWGGNEGIVAQLRLNQEIPMEGRKGIHKLVGMAKWESRFHPERALNPMF